MYFGKVLGRGFFIEGSSRFSYDKYVDYDYYYGNGNYSEDYEEGKEFNLGISLAV